MDHIKFPGASRNRNIHIPAGTAQNQHPINSAAGVNGSLLNLNSSQMDSIGAMRNLLTQQTKSPSAVGIPALDGLGGLDLGFLGGHSALARLQKQANQEAAAVELAMHLAKRPRTDDVGGIPDHIQQRHNLLQHQALFRQQQNQIEALLRANPGLSQPSLLHDRFEHGNRDLLQQQEDLQLMELLRVREDLIFHKKKREEDLKVAAAMAAATQQAHNQHNFISPFHEIERLQALRQLNNAENGSSAVKGINCMNGVNVTGSMKNSIYGQGLPSLSNSASLQFLGQRHLHDLSVLDQHQQQLKQQHHLRTPNVDVRSIVNGKIVLDGKKNENTENQPKKDLPGPNVQSGVPLLPKFPSEHEKNYPQNKESDKNASSNRTASVMSSLSPSKMHTNLTGRPFLCPPDTSDERSNKLAGQQMKTENTNTFVDLTGDKNMTKKRNLVSSSDIFNKGQNIGSREDNKMSHSYQNEFLPKTKDPKNNYSTSFHLSNEDTNRFSQQQLRNLNALMRQNQQMPAGTGNILATNEKQQIRFFNNGIETDMEGSPINKGTDALNWNSMKEGVRGLEAKSMVNCSNDGSHKENPLTVVKRPLSKSSYNTNEMLNSYHDVKPEMSMDKMLQSYPCPQVQQKSEKSLTVPDGTYSKNLNIKKRKKSQPICSNMCPSKNVNTSAAPISSDLMKSASSKLKKSVIKEVGQVKQTVKKTKKKKVANCNKKKDDSKLKPFLTYSNAPESKMQKIKKDTKTKGSSPTFISSWTSNIGLSPSDVKFSKVDSKVKKSSFSSSHQQTNESILTQNNSNSAESFFSGVISRSKLIGFVIAKVPELAHTVAIINDRHEKDNSIPIELINSILGELYHMRNSDVKNHESKCADKREKRRSSFNEQLMMRINACILELEDFKNTIENSTIRDCEDNSLSSQSKMIPSAKGITSTAVKPVNDTDKLCPTKQTHISNIENRGKQSNVNTTSSVLSGQPSNTSVDVSRGQNYIQKTTRQVDRSQTSKNGLHTQNVKVQQNSRIPVLASKVISQNVKNRSESRFENKGSAYASKAREVKSSEKDLFMASRTSGETFQSGETSGHEANANISISHSIKPKVVRRRQVKKIESAAIEEQEDSALSAARALLNFGSK